MTRQESICPCVKIVLYRYPPKILEHPSFTWYFRRLDSIENFKFFKVLVEEAEWKGLTKTVLIAQEKIFSTQEKCIIKKVLDIGFLGSQKKIQSFHVVLQSIFVLEAMMRKLKPKENSMIPY